MSSDSDDALDNLFEDIKGLQSDGENSEQEDNNKNSDSEREIVQIVKRKRTYEIKEDEKELNKFLFGDKEELIRNLEGKKSFFIDSAGGSDLPEDPESKQPAWHDSDDEEFIKKNGEIASKRLKRKFERIADNTPKWAQLNRKEEQEDLSSDDEITKTVGYLGKKSAYKSLPKGDLNFKRLKNMNRTTQKEGRIMSCQFHPKSTVGIITGLKGIVSIFAIDGKENKKIHSVFYEKFYINSCKLTNDGDELIIGGGLKDFHTYNLMNAYKQRIRLPKGVHHLKNFELSPCGKYMAVVGDYGEVHILHTITKELLCSMKQEHQSVSLNFTNDSNELFSHSDDNEVTIFDLRTQRVKHRFVDDGCVNGTSLALSSNGKFLATGSRQGFVNIYNCEDVKASKLPQPVKTLSNLTTEITDLKFNHTSEILAMCSVDGKNAAKLVHLSSGTVFSNFPTQADDIGNSTVLAFSPESGYFSMGTVASKVPLYRLRHYSNY